MAGQQKMLGRAKQASFLGGKNEDIASILPNQFLDSKNVELKRGELRTRGGTVLTGIASQQFIKVDAEVEGSMYKATGTATFAAGETILHLSGRDTNSDVLDSSSTANEERAALKVMGFVVAASAVNTTAATLTVEIYTTGFEWVAVPFKLYDNQFQPESTIPFSTASTLVVLGIDTTTGAIDDDFYDKWFDVVVTSERRPWVRFTFSASPASLELDVGSCLSIPNIRPQAFASITHGSGLNLSLVAQPHPVPRGTATLSVHWEAMQDLMFSQRNDAGAYLSAVGQAASATIRDDAHRVHKTGWTSVTATNAIPLTMGRIRQDNEAIVYIPTSGRILVTCPDGLAAFEPNYDQEGKFGDVGNGSHNLIYVPFPRERSVALTTEADNYLTIRTLRNPTACAFHDGHVFVGFDDGLVRWSKGTSLAGANEDVWPDDTFFVIPDSDGSRIVAMVSWSSWLVVFTERSIWTIEASEGTFSASNVQDYVPRKVVSGIGAYDRASIVEVDGELWFLSLGGIYAFNGTPAVRKLTHRIQDTFDTKLNEPLLHQACAAYDKPRGKVWFSVARAGSFRNDYVIVLDLRVTDESNTPGIFTHEGLNIEQLVFSQARNRLTYLNFFGLQFDLNVGRGDGIYGEFPIPSMVETGPLSRDTFERLIPSSVLLHLRHYIGYDYTVTPIVDDIAGETQTFTLDRRKVHADNTPGDGEDQYAWGNANYSWTADLDDEKPQQRRKERVSFRANDGQNIRVKIEGNYLSIIGLDILGRIRDIA